MRFTWLLLGLGVLLGLSGCGGGAVVFAPTPPPPDLSPLEYRHPGGAFTVTIPRNWSVFEQNTTVVASASFSAPGDLDPSLTFTVINLGRALDSTAFAGFLDQYQSSYRPDRARYTEQDRQAMGDGSWRLTGLRRTPGNLTQQINTFIDQTDGFIGISEAVLPTDPARLAELQVILNTFNVDATTPLSVAEPTILASAANSRLTVLNVATWTNPGGVFFVTGEVANYSPVSVTSVPVRVSLLSGDGLVLAEAADTVMGLGIAPGDFAPFSLRFGQGQPSQTGTFRVTVGDATWDATPAPVLLGGDTLTWTDESTFTEDRRLIISGAVTNTGQAAVTQLRATVTVFDGSGSVIGAAFNDLTPGSLASNESVPYQVVVQDVGGEPVNYVVSVQGLPETTLSE